MGSSLPNEVHPVQPIACVVEGDGAIRALLCETLSAMGYKPFSTDRGDIALFIVTQVRISLLVIDVVLPDMSGLGLIPTVRALSPGARVIAVSDGGRAGLPLFCELACHAGAHVALSVPITPETICASVHEAWRDDPAHEPWAPPAIAQRRSSDALRT